MEFVELRRLIATGMLSVGLCVMLFVACFTTAGAADNKGLVDLGMRCLHFGAATAVALPKLSSAHDAAHVGGWAMSWIGNVFT